MSRRIFPSPFQHRIPADSRQDLTLTHTRADELTAGRVRERNPKEVVGELNERQATDILLPNGRRPVQLERRSKMNPDESIKTEDLDRRAITTAYNHQEGGIGSKMASDYDICGV